MPEEVLNDMHGKKGERTIIAGGLNGRHKGWDNTSKSRGRAVVRWVKNETAKSLKQKNRHTKPKEE